MAKIDDADPEPFSPPVVSRRPLKKMFRYERWRVQTFAITWLAYFGFYITRKTFSVAKIGIDADPSIDLATDQMAWIDGVYLIAYAVGQFIWGMVGDRVGTRKVVLGGMIFSVLAAAAMGASSITVAFGILFCIQGLCQSTGWAPLVKNMGGFFSQHERGRVMGFWCTNYAVGGMFASIYAGYWGDMLGWRYAFFIPAVTLFMIAVLFFLLQRNQPEDVGLPPIEQYHAEWERVAIPEDTQDQKEDGGWRAIINIITNKNVMLLCASYFFIKPARYAILFWGPMYINEKIGSGMAESGAISSIFEFAGIISAILAGYISDKVFHAKRMPVCVISLLILGIFLCFVDDLPASRSVLLLSFAIMGLCVFAPDSIISGAASIDFGTKKGASTAAGFINGAGSIGAIIGGTIPGIFADKWGWSGVFMFLGCMSAFAGILLLPRWNTVPKQL